MKPRNFLMQLGFRMTIAGSLLIAIVVPAAAQRFSDWSQPENLGSPVNTTAADGTPFLSKDGLELFFASNRVVGSGPSDIYMSQRATQDSPWGDPVSLGTSINTDFEEFNPFLTISGRYLFFVSNRPGGCGFGDIYVARRLDKESVTEWSEPENLGCQIDQVNSAGIELGPSVFEHEDGTVYLYFSTGLRPGGLGFGDIYVSQQQTDGTFGPAVPIVEFNTIHNEIRPSIRARDGLEMYFDSLRPDSLGGLDLYRSERACFLCPWNEPTNLGLMVNSGSLDGSAKLSFDGTELYFMSNRPGGIGGLDIYVTRRERLTGKPDQ